MTRKLELNISHTRNRGGQKFCVRRRIYRVRGWSRPEFYLGPLFLREIFRAKFFLLFPKNVRKIGLAVTLGAADEKIFLIAYFLVIFNKILPLFSLPGKNCIFMGKIAFYILLHF